MLTLLIDTCTERAVIALFRDGVPLAIDELPPGLQNSQALLPAIERLFQQQGLTTNQLQLIVVGAGPGSYTGIRVGVAAAQAFSYAHKIPLIGVSTLFGLIPTHDGPFAALIDAKIGGAYFLIGQRQGSLVTWENEPAVAPLPELAEKLQQVQTIMTPLAPRLQQLLPGPWQWIERAPDPLQMIHHATNLFQQGRFSQNAQVDILYLRKSQAEIDRDAK